MKLVVEPIYLHNLFFEYEGGIKALDSLSLSVEENKILAIMGPNGAGKSTLCYILSGVIPNIYSGKRKGEVLVYGSDPWDQPMSKTAQTLGIVLQDPETQLFMPKVWMELAFGPASLGVPIDEIRKRIGEVLKIIGLEGYEERHPDELSGGQKQRVAIGAVLTMNPKILVLDEPTSQLDPIGTYEVLYALRRLKETTKITIIITTHKTDIVSSIADEILILNEGKAVAYGYPEEILSKPKLLDNLGVKPPTVPLVLEELKVNRFTLDVHEASKMISKLINNKIVFPQTMNLELEKEISMGETLISVKDLSYTYPGPPPVKALENVSFDIYKGEFIGIIGQNGSGKTTLVKTIVGLLKPTNGKIYFKGEDISRYTVAELSKKIGLVLQNPDYQLFTISSFEEVKFGLSNIGVPEKEIDDRVLNALETVGLKDFKDAFPFRLSFGDRRKLTVAATIAMKPEVLIMDEPTTAQDYRGRYLLADIAMKLNRENGLTVIMISHDMELIAKYTDRLVLMKDGRILLEGPTRYVFSEKDILRETFIKPPLVTELSLELKKHGVPVILTVNELKRALKRGE